MVNVATAGAEAPGRADAEARLGLGDPRLRLVLVVALGLQLLAWSQLEGYQLADSVEYLERAQALARGERVLDSVDIRGFGFPALFAPLFLLADALGLADLRPVATIASLLQMLLGLELVRVTAALAARLAGRRAGLAAGLVVGLNPYFLLYSATPVSGLAAAVCIGHALHHLLFRLDFARGLRGGLWLGAALLVAYKTVLIAAPLMALLALVDRKKRWRGWFGSVAGYALGILAAVVLDRLCYGAWGQSIDLYFRQNFGQIATRFALRLELWDLASWFWEFSGGETSTYVETPTSSPRELMGEPNALYHLLHLDRMVAWPMLALGALALVRIVLRGARATRLLAAVFLIGIAAVSLKKSNDFRLLLPALPCIGALCGLGWQWLFGERLSSRLIAGVGALAIVGGGVLGWREFETQNNSHYAGYWRAMERLNAAAADRDEPLVTACAWHWAVFLRDSADVELVKLPHQLDRWPALEAADRAESLEALHELDAFITHLAVLLGSRDLFAAVNARFEVDAVLYERERFGTLGPIVLFRTRTGSPDARTFLERRPVSDPERYAEDRGLRPGQVFGHASDASRPLLELVGWSYAPLPGDGHGWLELHWRPAVDALPALLVRPRILTRFQELPWEDQDRLGRGLVVPGEPGEDELLVEGWPVVAAVAPFDWTLPWQPLYPPDASDPTVPGTLWLRLMTVSEEGGEGAALPPVVAPGEPPPRTLADGFVQVGGIDVLVPDAGR